MKKKFTLFLSVMVLFAVVSGCAIRKTATQDAPNESVALKWVLGGPGKQKESDLVWEEFNKQLQAYVPNTTIEFEVIPFADYGEKWKLMMASDEQVDIAWAGYAIPSFVEEVEREAYLPLDELIQKHAPDLKAELPEWLLNLGKVDGITYAIPNYQVMATTPIGVRAVKELSSKYLDYERLFQTYQAWEKDPDAGKDFYGVFEDFLRKVKENGRIGNGVGVATFGSFPNKQNIDTTTVPNFLVDLDTMEVFCAYEADYYKLWWDTAADWYKKGYIRSDILSVPNPGVDQPKNNYVMWQHRTCYSYQEKAESAQYGYDIEVIPIGTKNIIKNEIPVTCTTIPRTSINPTRAMKVIDLMNTKKGKDIYNMLVFGLEGIHYKNISDNRIETSYLTTPTTNDAYGIQKWVVGNTIHAYETQNDMEGWSDFMQDLDNNAQISSIIGFKPDTSSIGVEIAQVTAVAKEYVTALDYGVSPNHEEVYREFMSKLEMAGSKKIITELQAQLDKWLESK